MRRVFKSCDAWIVLGLLAVAAVAKGPALAAQVRSALPFAGETPVAATPEQPGTDANPAAPGAAPATEPAPTGISAPSTAPANGSPTSQQFSSSSFVFPTGTTAGSCRHACGGLGR